MFSAFFIAWHYRCEELCVASAFLRNKLCKRKLFRVIISMLVRTRHFVVKMRYIIYKYGCHFLQVNFLVPRGVYLTFREIIQYEGNKQSVHLKEINIT